METKKTKLEQARNLINDRAHHHVINKHLETALKELTGGYMGNDFEDGEDKYFRAKTNHSVAVEIQTARKHIKSALIRSKNHIERISK